MDFVTAALSEPVAVAYHAVQIGIRGFDAALVVRVAVLGGGAIGLATALVAISQGAVSVMLAKKVPRAAQLPPQPARASWLRAGRPI